MKQELYRKLVRGSWLLLILWQPLWHGWLAPQRWLLGVMLGLLLLLPLTGIWLLRPQSIIIGSLLALAMLIIGCMELVAVGLHWPAQSGALMQTVISGVYLLVVMWHGRQLKQAKKQTESSSHG